MHALILFLGVVGLNWRSWVDSKHIELFGELDQNGRTIQSFAEVPILPLISCLFI